MDHRSGVVAWRGVDDHTRRLVDDRDVLVLINDVERDLLRPGFDDVSLGNLEFDDVPGHHPVGRIRRASIDENEVTFDQPCGRGAAQLGRLFGQESIEPGRRGRRDQLAGRRSRKEAIISTTPIDIAESATLKTGQKWKLMKSVTVPWTMRS